MLIFCSFGGGLTMLSARRHSAPPLHRLLAWPPRRDERSYAGRCQKQTRAQTGARRAPMGEHYDESKERSATHLSALPASLVIS